MTHRNHTMGFPMSLTRTAYTSSKLPKGALKNAYKSGLVSKKFCYKVSLRENFQRQSCKAFTGLSICAQMVGRGCTLLPVPEILGQIEHALKNADFQINIRS